MADKDDYVDFLLCLFNFAVERQLVIPRVHKGRRVSNCPIVPAASPRTPLALICEELLFSQISIICCISCDA